MKIVVWKSTMVKPAEETPKISLSFSNLDLLVQGGHTQVLYFYRPRDVAKNFFDPKVMKEALSRVLVPFYPVAGRLKKDKNGRIETDCQGQGVLLVEAESGCVLEDFGDFAPRVEFLELIPTVDFSLGIESCPLLVSQVTYFRCGGVSIGLGLDHRVFDGSSVAQFVNSWSEIARGLEVTLPPFLDRTILRARQPPQPSFPHIEYQPPPPITSPSLKSSSDENITSIFEVTRDQLNLLKEKSKEAGNTIKCSSFEMLAAHVWKCVCKARGLPDDQDTKLFILADGRARLQPLLPRGYFGNVILMATPIAVAGKLNSTPTSYTASIIHDAIVQINKDYILSAIDYLEIQPDLNTMNPCAETFRYAHLGLNSWVKLPIYEADFGWGRPIFALPAFNPYEGTCYVLRSATNDGSMHVAITLQAQHMKVFSKLLYDGYLPRPRL